MYLGRFNFLQSLSAFVFPGCKAVRPTAMNYRSGGTRAVELGIFRKNKQAIFLGKRSVLKKLFPQRYYIRVL